MIEDEVIDNIELLPCPRCRGYASFNFTESDYSGDKWYEPYCTSCGLTAPGDEEKHLAFAWWNDRRNSEYAESLNPAETIEHLEAELSALQKSAQNGGEWFNEFQSIENYMFERGLWCAKDISTRPSEALISGIKRLEAEHTALRAANEWKPIKHENDLPNDQKDYWVTYRDFYDSTLIGKGRRDGNAWEVGKGLKISNRSIIAVMPEFIPTKYEVKSEK